MIKTRSRDKGPEKKSAALQKYLLAGIALFVLGVGFLYYVTTPEEAKQPAAESEIKFYDVRVQAPEFISYYDSITLTPAQKKIKNEALSSLPAPCCADNPMSTCCCTCNHARATWGLSNFLITKHGYNAEQLKDAVSEWTAFTYKNGYSGEACYKGRCNLPFEQDGCGGMTELILD